ncbi:NADPH-dependent FMN reductase [Streptomyces sp. 142MFCol3.1]|uniref:NADPH-dependent FMN reductase n=1 Tax=Streptomyces sp. 142MFCol3.1 TaxID=1172179 RepID=UPI0003FE6702|nr:NADPH-dependent FMN reductase [Streptomyces sp. 142MFCol3.1]
MTPEYNHSTSGVLENAIDFLYAEWHNKAVGFVSHGSTGGTRVVEHLRLVAGELQMADVRSQVALSLFTDFENFSVFRPGGIHLDGLNTMLDQLLNWSHALRYLRWRAGAHEPGGGWSRWVTVHHPVVGTGVCVAVGAARPRRRGRASRPRRSRRRTRRTVAAGPARTAPAMPVVPHTEGHGHL